MSNFNLENYETVKERKKRFFNDYPDGSLITELVYHEKGHCIIKGFVYRNKEELEKNLPHGVSYAEEYQGEGGFANKHCWMENCDESAIGRALDNAGYSGNNKCSREEIEKVQRHDAEAKVKEEFGSAPTVQEMRDVAKDLPDAVIGYFKNMGYSVQKVYKFCAEHNFDNKKIEDEVNSQLLNQPEVA